MVKFCVFLLLLMLLGSCKSGGNKSTGPSGKPQQQQGEKQVQSGVEGAEDSGGTADVNGETVGGATVEGVEAATEGTTPNEAATEVEEASENESVNNTPESLDPNYVDQPLSGMINNLGFLVKYMVVHPYQDTEFWQLSGLNIEATNACSNHDQAFANSTYKVLGILPNNIFELDSYDISQQFKINLVDLTNANEKRNQVASQGFVQLKVVDAGKASLKMYAFIDNQNFVNGSFDVIRCCLDPLSNNAWKICE